MSRGKPGRFRGDMWFHTQVESRMRRWLKEQQACGKAPKGSLESLRRTEFYKREFERHAKLFKEERKLLAEERVAHKREAAVKALAEQKALEERDQIWAQEHEADTDEELLYYLRRCADELGHTPCRREVPGSTYIGQRFGSWSVALHYAQLPFPRGMKPPKQEALNAYKKKQKKSMAACHAEKGE